MIEKDTIRIASISTRQIEEINKNILSLDVNFSMNEASQISFEVLDPGMRMGKANFFVIGRDVLYKSKSVSPDMAANGTGGLFVYVTLVYEIASVECSQRDSNSAIWKIEARPKGIQQMKRDRKASQIQGANQDFITNAAKKYKMEAVVENTTKSKSISTSNGNKQAENLWNVMQGLANTANYALFESDGVIYFGSQKWFLGKWGTNKSGGKVKLDKNLKPIVNKQTKKIEKTPIVRYIPFNYPNHKDEKHFFLMQMPNVRKSDNDPFEVQGSMIVDRKNGMRLRPGMTIKLSGLPTMSGLYVITDVTFKEESTEPVNVSFRTPELLPKEKIQDLEIGPVVSAIYSIEAVREEKSLQARPAQYGMINWAIPAEVKPIASASTPLAYPKIPDSIAGETVVAAGNIDLWNRPVATLDGEGGTSLIYVWHDVANSVFVIIERVWCIDGVGELLTESEALDKYLLDGLHCGKFSNFDTADFQKLQLRKVSTTILKKRFPKTWKQIANGKAPAGYRC